MTNNKKEKKNFKVISLLLALLLVIGGFVVAGQFGDNGEIQLEDEVTPTADAEEVLEPETVIDTVAEAEAEAEEPVLIAKVETTNTAPVNADEITIEEPVVPLADADEVIDELVPETEDAVEEETSEEIDETSDTEVEETSSNTERRDPRSGRTSDPEPEPVVATVEEVAQAIMDTANEADPKRATHVKEIDSGAMNIENTWADKIEDDLEDKSEDSDKDAAIHDGVNDYAWAVSWNTKDKDANFTLMYDGDLQLPELLGQRVNVKKVNNGGDSEDGNTLVEQGSYTEGKTTTKYNTLAIDKYETGSLPEANSQPNSQSEPQNKPETNSQPEAQNETNSGSETSQNDNTPTE